MKPNPTDILTAPAVALYLGIEQDEAAALLQREGFPSTEVAPGARVVRRDLLELWVLQNSRGFNPSPIDALIGGE
jgi:hypothetical protein